MRRASWIMGMALGGLGLAGVPAAAQVPPGSEQVVSQAETFLRKLEANDGAGAMALVGPQMKAAGVTAEMLTVSWKQLSGGSPLTGLRASAVNEIQGYKAVDFAAQFGAQVQWFRVSLNGQQQVEGFRVIPQSAATPWDPPLYAHRDMFDEVELTVGAEGWPLGATLTLPRVSGKVPVVVLVHGSGPNDRNEAVGAVQVFHDLAWGLASNGIAVLRYDKRTFKHGARMVGLPITVDEEVITDALTALAKVREQASIDPQRVYLLGHSLGGMLAPEIAVKDGKLAGVILMAGATRPLAGLAIEQLDYIASLPESQDSAKLKQIASYRALLVKVQKHELAPTEDAGGAPASYMYDLDKRDPAQFGRQLKVPALVLQGGRDYQVTKTDYDAWQVILKNVNGTRFRWYPDLNHLFVIGQGKATPSEYATSRGHVDARVITDIAEFVKRQ